MNSSTMTEILKKKKLKEQAIKLKTENRMLCERIRRLQKKMERVERTRKNKEDPKEHETLHQDCKLLQLGCKLLPTNVAQLLSTHNVAQIKSKHGRRYTSNFKQFALQLFFLSPRNYRELKKQFALPSIRSLQSFTQTWKIKPGINNNIFDVLSVKLNSLPPLERHCILCVDEMSLKAHLFYNISQDEIIGFEDMGNKKSAKSAKNALVIMARSIAGDWKLPVCFCLMETTCKSNVLQSIIFDVIRKLQGCGATVHALISDMGSNFIQLSRQLGISTENSVFLVDDFEILYIFDTPHLMKSTRNNLYKHRIQFRMNKIASWAHIVEFYNRDSKQWIKTAPKLSKNHIEPTNFQKMKVKYAVEVFSNRVAAGMCTQMSFGFLSSEAVGTIDFIDHFDKLFDVLNSSAINNPKEYGKVFTGSKKQIQFLEQIINIFKTIKVIDENDVPVKVNCFKCWQITIRSIMLLWEKLKCHDFPYLRTRKINQDCIENFFDFIRQQGGNRLNPTAIQFTRAFKKLFSMNILQHTDTQNCATDTDKMLNLFGASCSNPTANPLSSVFISSSVTCVRPSLDISNHDYYNMKLPEENAFRYVCGYLIKKCSQMHICETCTSYLNENKTVIDDTSLYCSFQAFVTTKENQFGNLHIASYNFCSYIHELEKVFITNFENNCFQQNIGNHLFQLAQTVPFEAPCPNFPQVYLIKLFIRMRIYFTLSQHNKECGKSVTKKNKKLCNILNL